MNMFYNRALKELLKVCIRDETDSTYDFIFKQHAEYIIFLIDNRPDIDKKELFNSYNRYLYENEKWSDEYNELLNDIPADVWNELRELVLYLDKQLPLDKDCFKITIKDEDFCSASPSILSLY